MTKVKPKETIASESHINIFDCSVRLADYNRHFSVIPKQLRKKSVFSNCTVHKAKVTSNYSSATVLVDPKYSLDKDKMGVVLSARARDDN